MRGRKLWHGLGGCGVVILVSCVAVLSYELLKPTQFGDHHQYFVMRSLAEIALIAVLVAVGWGRYKRSSETKPYQEVLGPLVASEEEYCLILRPFGSDGEVVMPHRLHGASTMEQVIARAARKSLGLKTYALVDQDRRLAPPGPIWMRSPHDQWQTAVRTLIRRAHSVVLVLPPGQGIRAALKWEVDQITQHNLQTRLTVVLPPVRHHKDDHRQAFLGACEILAALEGFAGSVDDGDLLRVHRLELTLHERTQVVKYCRSKPEDHPELCFWYSKPQRGHKRSARFFQKALVTAFRTTEQELSGLGFSARYPRSPSP
ncbi:hypothetical protein ACIQ9Q_40535 [Streptomyces sp. NPDC094438]|uniref:hypothetical protein n=1 Tax=Streptomyces sp. NPDC094438 TaxID=3366061 RepID=UPI0037FB20C5